MAEIFRDKKKMILATLILILAFSLVYRLTHPYRQPEVDTLTYLGSKPARTGKGAVQKEVSVAAADKPLINMDMFLNPPVRLREQKKAIFSDRRKMAHVGTFSDQSGLEQISENNPPLEQKGNSIKEDLGSFRSFGYMDRKGERTVFLEKGKQIMLVRKGDRIEGKYLVKDITEDELVLTVISDNQSVYIDLGDL